MSRRETPMILWYWRQIGGLLLEEFQAVPRSPGCGRRLLDAVIVLGDESRRAPVGTRLELRGRDVVVVQAKNSRLGMYLMGQTLFSLELVRRFRPRSACAVALCSRGDELLQPMLEAYEGCTVVVCPSDVCRRDGDLSRPQRRPGGTWTP